MACTNFFTTQKLAFFIFRLSEARQSQVNSCLPIHYTKLCPKQTFLPRLIIFESFFLQKSSNTSTLLSFNIYFMIMMLLSWYLMYGIFTVDKIVP